MNVKISYVIIAIVLMYGISSALADADLGDNFVISGYYEGKINRSNVVDQQEIDDGQNQSLTNLNNSKVNITTGNSTINTDNVMAYMHYDDGAYTADVDIYTTAFIRSRNLDEGTEYLLRHYPDPSRRYSEWHVMNTTTGQRTYIRVDNNHIDLNNTLNIYAGYIQSSKSIYFPYGYGVILNSGDTGIIASAQGSKDRVDIYADGVLRLRVNQTLGELCAYPNKTVYVC